MPDSRAEQLVVANHLLANEGVIRALGHASVRSAAGDTMHISRSKAPKLVTAEDILEIGFDAPDDRTYNESVIHRAIYRNHDEINAIVHHHAPAIMPFAIAGIPIRPVVPPGVLFRSGVPTFDGYDDEYGYLVVTEAEGERMASELGEHRAQLLSNHGANVVGSTLKEAIVLTFWLVQNARQQFQALQIGDPSYYTGPEASVAATEEILLSENVIDRLWEFFVQELPDGDR